MDVYLLVAAGEINVDKLSALICRNPKDVYPPVAAEKIHVAKLTTWISRSTEERMCAYGKQLYPRMDQERLLQRVYLL